ncbi:MAG: hypothetical protein WC379_10385 [Methanoregula sp.]|jgi:hypothetical protein
MVKGKRRQVAGRGGNAIDRHGGMGRNDEQWSEVDPEDDPFRDLRPRDDDVRNPASDEYMWPDMTDEYENDD